jgi:hypothetical protein
MLAKPDPHPLDALVRDPSGRPPLCDEAEFVELLDEMVADHAPRLFAIVQEYGERVDAKFAAWGMAFDDHVDVIGVGGSVHVGAPSADGLLRRFHFGNHVTPRLVWVKPAD